MAFLTGQCPLCLLNLSVFLDGTSSSESTTKHKFISMYGMVISPLELVMASLSRSGEKFMT